MSERARLFLVATIALCVLACWFGWYDYFYTCAACCFGAVATG